MNRDGLVVNRSNVTVQEPIDFKIVRSGFRNVQGANMATLTMMKNPILDTNGDYLTNINTYDFSQTSTNDLKIVNASAVSYDDLWNCQCEYNLPSIPYKDVNSDELADLSIEEYEFNPYVFNVRGDWRANKSYAYLTERTNLSGSNSNNPRKDGFFKEFTPFYKLVNEGWEKHEEAETKWTFANEVSLISAFGTEMENKDALNRYSSAQYGYNFTLPISIASNIVDIAIWEPIVLRIMDSVNTSDAHFSYKEITEEDGAGGVELSSLHAHSGYQSLLVPQNSEAGLTKELIGVIPGDEDADNDNVKDIEDNCPQTYNPYQEDYDEEWYWRCV